MTETLDFNRSTALHEAVKIAQQNETPEATVKRAEAFHAFLITKDD